MSQSGSIYMEVGSPWGPGHSHTRDNFVLRLHGNCWRGVSCLASVVYRLKVVPGGRDISSKTVYMGILMLYPCRLTRIAGSLGFTNRVTRLMGLLDQPRQYCLDPYKPLLTQFNSIQFNSKSFINTNVSVHTLWSKLGNLRITRKIHKAHEK